MWIVRVALNRPYTFVVLALTILLVGPIAILRTPTDIFPNINIPVVGVIWSYGGLGSEELSNRIVSVFERSVTTTVNDIEHIESQTLRGISIVKIFFQPNVKIEMAIAQVTAISQSALRQMPPGTNPPFVLSYNASTVPVLQLALSGQKLSEQQLYDLGANFLRTQLATVQGASIPQPYGGKQPQIQVDLNLAALQAKGLAPLDVVAERFAGVCDRAAEHVARARRRRGRVGGVRHGTSPRLRGEVDARSAAGEGAFPRV